ncbi:putative nucleoside diphosphate kinase 5, partial [Cucurbita argyrosperma subsp. argyrosperma]
SASRSYRDILPLSLSPLKQCPRPSFCSASYFPANILIYKCSSFYCRSFRCSFSISIRRIAVSSQDMKIRLVLLGSRFLFFFVLVSIAFSGIFASNGGMETEKTLAMIKPDGLRGNYTDSIRRAIVESGFRILKERVVELDEDRASRFYAEHSSKSFFPTLVKYMTSGPVCVMVLEKQNAIADWRAMIGPTDATKAKATHPNRS